MELILVIGIVAILAASMVPVISSARMQARVASILQSVDTLSDACRRYHADTGIFANEHMTPFGGPHPNRGLSSNDGRSLGWDGPYLADRISIEDNPYNGGMIVWRVLRDFDLDGDGTIDKRIGFPGNYIVVSNLPERACQMIDGHLDKNIPGDWKVTGRVRFTGGAFGAAWIYVIGD